MNVRSVKRVIGNGSFAEAKWKQSSEVSALRGDLLSSAERLFFSFRAGKPSDSMKRTRCDWEFCACDDETCLAVIA